MGGRIYDPTLGRFLQADPFIQAPMNSQSYNRFAYVFNNPMTNTDPSGFISLNPFKNIGRALIKGAAKIFGADAVGMVGNIASIFCGPWAPACAGAWNYEFSRAMGASSSGALKGALTAAASVYAFQQIGNQFNSTGASNINALIDGAEFSVKSFGGNLLTTAQAAQQVAVHAIVGGVAAELSGGKFGHGFISAGVTKGVGGVFLPGGSNLSSGQIASGTAISAAIGGTVSSLTGGKFANGAKTATFQYLFNQMSRLVKRSWMGNVRKDIRELSYQKRQVFAHSMPSPPPGLPAGASIAWLLGQISLYDEYLITSSTTAIDTIQETIYSVWYENEAGEVVEYVGTSVIDTVVDTTITSSTQIYLINRYVNIFQLPNNSTIVHRHCIVNNMKGC